MQFSICVDALYRGHDFYESIEELGRSELKNIEFWGWWDRDIDRLAKLKETYGLTYTAFCTRLVSPVRADEQQKWLDGFRESLAVAQRLGCRQLITQGGRRSDEPFEIQYARMIETMSKAAKMAEESGIVLLLEPVNSRYENKVTFLDNSELGFQIIRDVDSPAVRLLFDLYHIQIDEGDVLNRLLPDLPLAAHLHAAGSDGRHELPKGELNYSYIFRKLEEAGYPGYVGLEYIPEEEPLKGLLAGIRDGRWS